MTDPPHLRPLVLIDVDGVLQPVGSFVPPGYTRFDGQEATVVLRPEHGRWLAELPTTVEIVWATTWGGRANRLIGDRLGLPAMEWIDLGDLPRSGTRKLDAVSRYVDDRPLVWIDNELYDDAVAWAESRPAPTMLRRTRASVGLTREDIDSVKDFLTSL